MSRALSPTRLLSLGTSRQPSSVTPSSSITCAIRLRIVSRSRSSRGRNTSPAPYEPASGSVNGTALRKNVSGVWIMMPAPSPVFASHPQAPRCSRLIRTSSALRTIAFDRRPLMSTTKPTPQASRLIFRVIEALGWRREVAGAHGRDILTSRAS